MDTTKELCDRNGAGGENIILPIFPVNVKAINGTKVVKTYATVLNNFYVDDCLKSVESEKEAVSLYKDLKCQWHEWMYSLHLLSDYKMARCYRPENFGKVTWAQLYHFCEAS